MKPASLLFVLFASELCFLLWQGSGIEVYRFLCLFYFLFLSHCGWQSLYMWQITFAIVLQPFNRCPFFMSLSFFFLMHFLVLLLLCFVWFFPWVCRGTWGTSRSARRQLLLVFIVCTLLLLLLLCVYLGLSSTLLSSFASFSFFILCTNFGLALSHLASWLIGWFLPSQRNPGLPRAFPGLPAATLSFQCISSVD